MRKTARYLSFRIGKAILPFLAATLLILFLSDRAGATPLKILDNVLAVPINMAYSHLLEVSGGVPPYSGWTLTDGSLPPGLSLLGVTGEIHGVTASSGAFPFTVTVEDASGQAGAKELLAVTYRKNNLAPRWATAHEADPLTPTTEAANGVATDAAGNSYIAGVHHNGTDSDFLVMKLDPAGAEVWKKTHDTGDADVAKGVAVDGSGNVYVAGTVDNGSDTDVLTVKYDGAGNEIWTASYSGAGDDSAEAVAVDDAGGVYVAGAAHNGTDRDVLLIKYNDLGQTSWETLLGAGMEESGGGIALDDAGNIYVAGKRENGGNMDCLAIKVNSAGHEVWTSTYATAINEECGGVALDSLGSVYVVGGIWNPAIPVGSDYLLLKMDASGAHQWARTHNTGFQDVGQAIAIDADDNIFVSGYSLTGSSKTAFTLKYDIGGGFHGARGDVDGIANALCIAENGDVIAAGASLLNADEDPLVIRYEQLPLVDLFMNYLNSPSMAKAGDTITVYNQITNSGPDSLVEPFRIGFYFSDDTAITTTDIGIGFRNLNSIGAGAQYSEETFLEIPAATKTGRYYVGAIADSDYVINETNEDNNSIRYWGQILVSHGDPDLIVTNLSATPDPLLAGEKLSVTFTVENRGAGYAGYCNMGIYLSQNDWVTTGDRYLGSHSVQQLSPGETVNASVTMTIPWDLAAGTYWLGIIADMDQRVIETDETNNVSSAPLAVNAPGYDLTVTAFSAPAAVKNGETMDISVTVKNQGQGYVGGSVVGIYLSRDETITTNDTLIHSVWVPELGPQGAHEGASSVSIPYGMAAGTYYIGAIADYYDGIKFERDEKNNTFNGGPITLSKVLGDLTVGGLTLERSSVATGENVQVNFMLANSGEGYTNYGNACIFISPDEMVTTSDRNIGCAGYNTMTPGTSRDIIQWVAIPQDLASGTYSLGVIADTYETTEEADESNNIAVANELMTIYQPQVDLEITAVNAPAALSTGETVSVSFTVRNNGGDIAGSTYACVHLTSSAATPLGDCLAQAWVSQMDPGAELQQNVSVVIPYETAAGEYFLGVMVDSNNTLTETDEGNNWKASAPVTVSAVKPDLVVIALETFSSQVSGGQRFKMGFKVRNIGQGTAPSSSAMAVLSTDETIGPEDWRLADYGFWMPSLAPGQEYQIVIEATVPAAIPQGTYYLGGIVDYDQRVREANEANNTLKGGTMTVAAPRADLVPTGLAVTPTTVSAGGTFTAELGVRNQGAVHAGWSEARIYLSRDATISRSDVFLTSIYMGELMPGASSHATVQVTIPPDFTGGDIGWDFQGGQFYVGVIADATNVVAESNETNNAPLGSTVMTITNDKPDLEFTTLSMDRFLVLAGETVTVDYAVKNNGPGFVSSSYSYSGFYLSSTGGERFLTSSWAPNLAPGEEWRNSFTIQIPHDLPAGEYTFRAVADYMDNLVEVNEENNTLIWESLTVTSGTKDLEVVSIQVRPPDFGTGQPVVVDLLVRNNGTGYVNYSSTGVYLFADSAIGDGDKKLYDFWISPLAPGETVKQAISLIVPMDMAAGQYYIGAVADQDERIAEVDESNNVAIGHQVTLSVQRPDLAITKVSASPFSIVAGDQMTVIATQKNLGAGWFSEYVSNGIYLSADQSLGADDILLSHVWGGNRLAPGQSQDLNYSLQVPYTISSGTYYVIVATDAENRLVEEREDNNFLAGNQVVILGGNVDIAVTSITPVNPVRLGQGENLRVAFTVRNKGDVRVNVSTGFYLSADKSITAEDAYVGDYYFSLAAGEERYGEIIFAIPFSLPAGTYFLGAMADQHRQYQETDEVNNIMISPLPVTVLASDLQVVGAAGAVKGGKVKVLVKVRNNGLYTVRSVNLALFLTPDERFPIGAPRLGELHINQINPGEESIASAVFNVSEFVPTGEYYLGAVADQRNEIWETDEENNTFLGSRISYTGLPDLVISSRTSFNNLIMGKHHEIPLAVRNESVTPSGPTTAGIYLSQDTEISTGDTLLGSFEIPGLNGFEEYRFTATVFLSQQTPPGLYYAGQIVDPGNAVAELREDNNMRYYDQVLVTAEYPDLAMDPPAMDKASVLVGRENFTITYTIHNKGPGDVGEFGVGFFLSPDPAVTGTGNDIRVSSGWHAGIKAGGSLTASLETSLWGDIQPGKYYLGAIADYRERVFESEETNNAAVGEPFTVHYKDLIVSHISGFGDKGQISYTLKIRNNGDVPVEASQAGVYLSADRRIDTWNDRRIDLVDVPPLAAGQEEVFDRTLPVPADTPAGAYYIGAVANDSGKAAESNDWNNDGSGNELFCSSVARPKNVSPADQDVVRTLTPTLASSDFGGDLAGGSHQASRWQISEDPFFARDGLRVETAEDYTFEEFPLPFTFPYHGRKIVKICASSVGHVELLETDEVCDRDNDGDTYADKDYVGRMDVIFAFSDYLYHEGKGYLKVFDRKDRVVVEWYTATDRDRYLSMYPNLFQLILHQNGAIQWHFKEMEWVEHYDPPFTGLYAREENKEVKAGSMINEPSSFAFDPSTGEVTRLAAPQWDDETVYIHHDSGETSSRASYQVPAEAGLVFGGSYYWRVRYFSSSGNWSDWSAPTVMKAVATLNNPPAPTAPPIAMKGYKPRSTQVDHNDPDPGDIHTYGITVPPKNGIATINATGLATYQPDKGVVGTDQFTVTVTDNQGASGNAVVYVFVNLLPCTDGDGDGYFKEGKTCGPLDCNDADRSVNPGAPELCNDGKDNDCDGDVDMKDGDCSQCVPTHAKEIVCGDKRDNDCDGLVDCHDQDCVGSPLCCMVMEKGFCGDGLDNDCDGLIDCADNDCRKDPKCRKY